MTLEVEKVQAVAERALRHWLGPHGLAHVEVEARENHDGEPSLYVIAYYREGSPVPSGRLQSDAHTALHEALEELGENRFPYLGHRFSKPERYREAAELADR